MTRRIRVDGPERVYVRSSGSPRSDIENLGDHDLRTPATKFFRSDGVECVDIVEADGFHGAYTIECALGEVGSSFAGPPRISYEGKEMDWAHPGSSSLAFEGRATIITGAGSGIGRHHALDFARRGARMLCKMNSGPRPRSGRAIASVM